MKRIREIPPPPPRTRTHIRNPMHRRKKNYQAPRGEPATPSRGAPWRSSCTSAATVSGDAQGKRFCYELGRKLALWFGSMRLTVERGVRANIRFEMGLCGHSGQNSSKKNRNSYTKPGLNPKYPTWLRILIALYRNSIFSDLTPAEYWDLHVNCFALKRL